MRDEQVSFLLPGPRDRADAMFGDCDRHPVMPGLPEEAKDFPLIEQRVLVLHVQQPKSGDVWSGLRYLDLQG